MQRITPPLAGFGLLLGLTLAVTACARNDASHGWSISEDTLPSGVAVVVNTPRADKTEPDWQLEEELRIGSVDEAGPMTFGDILAIAVTRDGRIAVLDRQAQEIRVFNATGQHQITYGRHGAGPGEFRAAYGMVLGAGGRFWVPDHANARISVIDVDSGFVASYPMQVRGYGYVWDGALAADGSIVEPTSTITKPRKYILRVYRPDMTSVDSMPLPDPRPIDPKNPPTAFYWEAPARRASGYITIPFTQNVMPVVMGDAQLWSASFESGYRIKRWRAGGDTTLVIENRRAPIAVSAAERDAAIEKIRSYLRESGASPEADWSRVPQTKPQVVRMFPGENGGLWVETSAPDSSTRFDIYDRNGRIEGTAASASKWRQWVRPVVRGEHVWGVVTDDMDVQYVVRTKLVRREE